MIGHETIAGIATRTAPALHLWARGMGVAAWQTAMLAAVVAAVCRLFPTLPPRGRHWLWWLVCLKSILALLPLTIALPVLPARLALAVRVLPGGVSHPTGPPAAAVPSPASPVLAQSAQSGVPTAAGPLENDADLRLGLLFVIWAAGTAAIALRGVVCARRSRPRNVAPAGDVVAAAAADAARIAGMRRPPHVVVADAASLHVVGALRPVIVVPRQDAARLDPEQLRMAFAHEIAHLRGGDLWLGLVPAVAEALLWPLPWVRMAAREYLAAREEACDRASLAAGDRAAYARLLLRLSAPGADLPAAAIGPAYAMTRRRLVALSARPASGGTLALCALLCAVAAAAQAPIRLVPRLAAVVRSAAGPQVGRYRLVDLGPLPNDDDAVGGINDRDDVALVEGGRALLFRNGKIAPLPPLAHYRQAATAALSPSGSVAATACNYADYPHAYVPGGGALPGLPSLKYAAVGGINDARTIAGSVQSGRLDIQGAEVARAVVWGNGRPQPIGTLGGDFSRAYAINDAGMVVGKADLPRNYLRDSLHGYVRPTHAFLWQNGRMRDLDTLGGRNSLASAINARGDAAGYAETTAGDVHACLWQAGSPIDLGTLPGGASSQAEGISDDGVVVGTSDTAAGESHATAWIEGRAIDLNERAALRGWTLTEARAVNNRGWIAGAGVVAGRRRAFLLVPLP